MTDDEKGDVFKLAFTEFILKYRVRNSFPYRDKLRLENLIFLLFFFGGFFQFFSFFKTKLDSWQSFPRG